MNHTGKCEQFLEKECGAPAFMMPSCTAALELACMMVLEPGDEVVLPSWAFPSCANVIILRGAIPVFIDVDENMNIDVYSMEMAISDRTKAVMVLHYAGVVGNIDHVVQKAKLHGLYVIEDAAQAIGNWKIKGDFGCLSFHYTKNIECGQGGALIVNNPMFLEKAALMMHCGTDKLKMYNGEQDYYNWLDVGSQYIMSEHQAKYLYDQLQRLDAINDHRKFIWHIYRDACYGVPESATEKGNGHLFWFFEPKKWDYIRACRNQGVKISSHYEALHNTIPGRKYGRTGWPISRATKAEEYLCKVDTSVTKEQAWRYSEVLWPSNTVAIRNIL